jgi:PAS domain-containing protein
MAERGVCWKFLRGNHRVKGQADVDLQIDPAHPGEAAASSIATPILLVDAEGTLIYYNEPAETIFNQRFDETGEMPASEWTARIGAVDDDRNPLTPENRPMMRVLAERCPISQTMWSRSTDGEWRHLHITAFPLIGERDVLFGAMSIFWEI